ncbi:protein phosphatase 2C catalytic subunit [Haematococcus lacustris]
MSGMSWINTVLSPAREGALPSFGLRGSVTSGSDTRDDGRVMCGYCLARGKRQNMEDFHYAQFQQHPRTGVMCGLFGIFDGHGGPNAADFVRSNLFINLFQNYKFPTDVCAAITEAYELTDFMYLRQDATSQRDDGCTGVTAVVIGSKLYVANVGDSRAVLCRAGKAIPLSVDHKPNTKEERCRIEQAGGVVVWAGTWRVGGVLAVSRAFGDRPLKRYVIATPDVKEEVLTSEDEFLIMASDGLWDVLGNADAVALIRAIPDAEKAAKRLSDEAIAKGSLDNVSCVVVRFKF